MRMHVCGASCHARKENLAESGILQELQLENKSSNHTYSFRMWDMVLWNKINAEKNIDSYMNTVMDDVVMEGNKIKSVICRQSTTELVFEFEAKVFVDATGNASLGYYSGAEYRVGSESRYEFNEPDAPEETEELNSELYKCVFGIWDHLKNGGEHGADTISIYKRNKLERWL